MQLPGKLNNWNADIVFGCDKLLQIEIDQTNKQFISKDNVIYDSQKKKLLFYPPGDENEYFSIDENVEIISRFSFANSKLTSISLPNSITTLEDYCFYSSRYLTTLTISSSNSTISKCAFAFCESLEQIIILSRNNYILEKAFYGCLQLKKIMFLGSEITTEENSFDKCVELNSFKTLNTFNGNNENLKSLYQYLNKNDLVTGSCGTDCYYYHDQGLNELTVFGNGTLNKIEISNVQNIQTIVIEDGIKEINGSIFNVFTNLQTIEYKGLKDISFINRIENNYFFGIKVRDYYESETFCGKEASKKYGKIENDIQWIISEGKLTVYGKGDIQCFVEMTNEAPWIEFKDDINEIVITNGIKTIGKIHSMD